MQALGKETWLQGGLSGTQRTGGLTEAQLTDELGPDFLQLPIPRNASATISWWQVRQAAFNRALQVHPKSLDAIAQCSPSTYSMPTPLCKGISTECAATTCCCSCWNSGVTSASRRAQTLSSIEALPPCAGQEGADAEASSQQSGRHL